MPPICQESCIHKVIVEVRLLSAINMTRWSASTARFMPCLCVCIALMTMLTNLIRDKMPPKVPRQNITWLILPKPLLTLWQECRMIWCYTMTLLNSRKAFAITISLMIVVCQLFWRRIKFLRMQLIRFKIFVAIFRICRLVNRPWTCLWRLYLTTTRSPRWLRLVQTLRVFLIHDMLCNNNLKYISSLPLIEGKSINLFILI